MLKFYSVVNLSFDREYHENTFFNFRKRIEKFNLFKIFSNEYFSIIIASKILFSYLDELLPQLNGYAYNSLKALNILHL